MQPRTHKLLVFAGEEGTEVEARDFKKLSEVIVHEYLSQGNPSYKNYLVDIVSQTVRAIPLKAHIYAGLTIVIAKNYPDVANKILEQIIVTLQNDLSAGNFSQALNSLNYLSEAMNISFLNSLNYMNLLEDLQQAAEKETDSHIKKTLLATLVKALPLCAASLYTKTNYEFKKYLQRLNKSVQGDDLLSYIVRQCGSNFLNDYSAMNRLGQDFSQIQQHTSKLRLVIDIKSAKPKQTQNVDLYKWQQVHKDEDYQVYRNGEGLVIRMWLEQLFNTFNTHAAILTTKFNNLVQDHVREGHQIRFLVETLVLRTLRLRNTSAQMHLLLNLRNREDMQHGRIVEDVLFEFFAMGETFDLSMIVSYSKLFSFLANNSRQQFAWVRFIENQQLFLKRSVLLKLILEKINLLNDKFKCQPQLANYDQIKPSISEEQFTSAADREVFENMEEALKKKTEAEVIKGMINNQREYQIFLEALFRKTCLSHTHLTVLSQRYSEVLLKFSDWDWDLINKIRNFFRHSFFHRLLYFRFMISGKYLSFASYINYVGGLTNKTDLQMLWIKVELNQLNNQFGKSLKNK